MRLGQEVQEVPRGAAGLNVERQIIESAPALARACRSWQRLPAIGIDTEFVRERTFYPGLGLIQVSDGDVSFLIDVVAISDLEPLRAVLSSPEVTKVFHSCGEDLEALHHRFGEFPRGVFDTQVAATLTGEGGSIGYAALAASMFGVELPKDKTRTHWLRRPLDDAQLRYAALDVVYLLPAWERLRERLRGLGRESWLREELEPLFDAERFLPDPERFYLRIGASRSLAPRQLAVLRALCAWRERQARRRNLPRNFVVREKALVDVARRSPRAQKALAAIDSLRPGDVKRHGAALLRQVRRALDLPDAELPRPAPALDLRPHRGKVKRLRSLVSRVADELSLPPEVVANRKTVERLVRRAVAGTEPVLPEELRGWRREVVGERLLDLLESTAATADD